MIREVVENQNEVDRRLNEMIILPNFIITAQLEKNREQYLEKKQFDSENINKNQEKEEDYSWYVIEFC